MADDLGDEIASSAQEPKRVKTDMGEVEQHNIKDQIAADQYLASKEAVKKKRRGLRFSKLIPPGAV